MKKYYFVFGVLGLLIGYFSKVDFWFEDGRDVFFPITKAQLKKKKQPLTADSAVAAVVPQAVAGEAAKAPNQIVDLEHLSQYELFHQLYNSKVLVARTSQAVYFEKIKNRLNSKYPAPVQSEHKTAYEKEVANRLGLLKAMSQFWPTPKEVSISQKEIKQLFHEIAKNKDENLMVRRQAFKNWLTFGNTAAQSEKNQLLASADSKLLHLISLSDENLIQSLTESAE